MTEPALSAAAAVQRCQEIFAHAWMVRTFVKHSPEAEEFPELLQVARTVFDVSRSLETRRDDPPAYLRQLRKKFRRLRAAAEQFRHDAPLASTHTNFQQAVLSLDACIAEFERILEHAPPDALASAPQDDAPATLDGAGPTPDDDRD